MPQFNIIKRAVLVFITLGIPALSQARSLPDFTELVDQLKPAVVNISTVHGGSANSSSEGYSLDPRQQLPEMFKRFFGDQFQFHPEPRAPRPQERSLGSGFIISRDGYILTNNHVIAGADRIIVRLVDRRELEAELIGSDKRSDLALLKVEADDLPVVTLGNPDQLKVGEWVLAIGSPFGFDYSVTAGIVSAIDRNLPSDNYVPFIQTDVAINPGNSGGPLFNMDGEVVGINSQIYTRSGGFMGLSFAIPMSVAMNVVSQLKDQGYVSRGWLGVVIQDVNRDLAESFGLKKPAGALIADIEPNGPADRSGLKEGDIITRYDGKEVNLSSELPHMVGITKAGSRVPVEVLRDGKTRVLNVKIGSLPNQQQARLKSAPVEREINKVGLRVMDLDSQLAESSGVNHGVVVREIIAGRSAEAAGMRIGDIITIIDGQQVDSAAQFEKIVDNLKPGKAVPVRIVRNGRAIFIPLKITK
jgi:serine protease Do